MDFYNILLHKININLITTPSIQCGVDWGMDEFIFFDKLLHQSINWVFVSAFSYTSTSPGSSSSSASYRSTPSPPPRAYSPQSAPLSSSSVSDEGIGMDYYPDDLPRKKKVSFPTYKQISSSLTLQHHVDHKNQFQSSWKKLKIFFLFIRRMCGFLQFAARICTSILTLNKKYKARHSVTYLDLIATRLKPI